MKRSPLKRKTPLKRQSAKRAKQNREYSKLRKEFLAKRPYCEIFEMCCTRKATDIHHVNYRNGKRLLDVEWWLPSCRACHTLLHRYPQYARKMGFLK